MISSSDLTINFSRIKMTFPASVTWSFDFVAGDRKQKRIVLFSLAILISVNQVGILCFFSRACIWCQCVCISLCISVCTRIHIPKREKDIHSYLLFSFSFHLSVQCHTHTLILACLHARSVSQNSLIQLPWQRFLFPLCSRVRL